MFTDWTQTDPHYFYLRGLICGIVLTAVVAMVIISAIQSDHKETTKRK